MSGKVTGTLKALLEIREEQRRMREELTELKGSVVGELQGVTAVLVDVRDLLRDRLDLRDEVRDHERRIAALERRTG
jgi:hypothetical protein